MTETAEVTAWDLIRAATACVTCGKEHEQRPACGEREHGITWASPDDGHPYRPRLKSTELSTLRLLAAELAASKNGGVP